MSMLIAPLIVVAVLTQQGRSSRSYLLMPEQICAFPYQFLSHRLMKYVLRCQHLDIDDDWLQGKKNHLKIRVETFAIHLANCHELIVDALKRYRLVASLAVLALL